ncbi:hypothetical protein LINPERHAP1_LOCUS4714, partial [Linum perenne]
AGYKRPRDPPLDEGDRSSVPLGNPPSTSGLVSPSLSRRTSSSTDSRSEFHHGPTSVDGQSMRSSKNQMLLEQVDVILATLGPTRAESLNKASGQMLRALDRPKLLKTLWRTSRRCGRSIMKKAWPVEAGTTTKPGYG